MDAHRQHRGRRHREPRLLADRIRRRPDRRQRALRPVLLGERPFFLEGSQLFSTPIQAVYTRTVTAPRWGVRGTGRFGSTSYTGLFAEDDGGGSVILPGSNSSDLANQEFRYFVA